MLAENGRRRNQPDRAPEAAGAAYSLSAVHAESCAVHTRVQGKDGLHAMTTPAVDGVCVVAAIAFVLAGLVALLMSMY